MAPIIADRTDPVVVSHQLVYGVSTGHHCLGTTAQDRDERDPRVVTNEYLITFDAGPDFTVWRCAWDGWFLWKAE